ncbi:GNAT family N-acetyltransferase [Candidatus Thorarchaeota archaeon]|nr:MAG: GNAT family N-acetyltransferase [Candidatus Thorarchaeota archaeon]
MIIRKFSPDDAEQLVSLIADYRVFLAGLKSLSKRTDIESAKNELNDYLSPRYSIHVAIKDDEIVGYLVCRIDQDVVWAESLYVIPRMRRSGIGSALFSKAEDLSKELGNDTVYNWIHPNNTGIINFLKKHNYDVLNLIEVRRAWKNEDVHSTICVGDQKFRY